MLGFDRITFAPNVMGGRACIRGMRVTVSLMVNLAANGMSTEEIIEAYPYLEPDDIRQALQCAACKRGLTSMKASELDKEFDEGKSISRYLDFSKIRRPEPEQKRVDAAFPARMIHFFNVEEAEE